MGIRLIVTMNAKKGRQRGGTNGYQATERYQCLRRDPSTVGQYTCVAVDSLDVFRQALVDGAGNDGCLFMSSVTAGDEPNYDMSVHFDEQTVFFLLPVADSCGSAPSSD